MKSLHGFTLADLKARTRPGKDGCWLWTGNRHQGGYPRTTKKGRNVFVHRLAYQIAKGPIPKGKSLWHRCLHPHCINPAHLRPVTRVQIGRLMVANGLSCTGSRHSCSKLTDAKVRHIRRVSAQGKPTCVELGKKDGVDSTLIVRIVHRERWKHVV